MADEDGRKPLDLTGEHRWHVPADRPGDEVPEQRIGQQADAIEVDEDRRVTQERQPVGHVASRSAR